MFIIESTIKAILWLICKNRGDKGIALSLPVFLKNIMQVKTFITTIILFFYIISGHAQAYKLFTFYNDGGHTMPRSNEPYSLIRNGKPAGSGITNSKGQIFTTLHKQGVREDWIIKFVTNEIGVLIYPNGTTKTFSLYSSSGNWEQHIVRRHDYDMTAEKLQQPYYWLELYNCTDIWHNKQYKIMCSNHVLATGNINDEGFIFFRTDFIKENMPFQLSICDGAVFNIKMLSIEKENFAIENDTIEKTTCSDTANFTFNQNAFNYGRPLLHAGVGYGKMRAKNWLNVKLKVKPGTKQMKK